MKAVLSTFPAIDTAILTAFKYYDVAKYVTDLEFSHILSIALVNEAFMKLIDQRNVHWQNLGKR